MTSAISNHSLMRWAWLTVIALAELTWLAIRVTVPSTGFLSWFKGFPSIFVTSLAVVSVLVWASSRGKLLELPVFKNFSHNPSFMILAHVGTFGLFFWITILVAEGDAVSSPFAVFWILAWAVTGLGAGAFWMLATMPGRFWIRLVRQNVSLVLTGIFIIAASWIFGFLTSRAWEPLLRPTFLTVKWLLLAFGQEVVSQPTGHLLGTSQFTVIIDPACAGYEGIGLIAVFTGVYFWLFRRRLRFPNAFILFPFAIIIIWTLNAIRVASLILVGAYLSPEIAVGGFHSQTGWLSFIVVSLCLVVVTQRMQFFSIETDSRAKSVATGKLEDPAKAGELVKVDTLTEVKQVSPTIIYLGPLMALLALTMITQMFSSGFDWLYPVRVLGTAIAIWFLWRPLAGRLNMARIFSWNAVGNGLAVYFIWRGLEYAFKGGDSGASIAENLGGVSYGLAASWLVFRVLGSVIIVPITEELAFRGYLLRRLLSADFEKVSSPHFTWLSFLGSSVAFGVLHGRWLAGTIAGMFYAWAMYRRGRIADPIIAHATTNALIAMEVMILGNWWLWS